MNLADAPDEFDRLVCATGNRTPPTGLPDDWMHTHESAQSAAPHGELERVPSVDTQLEPSGEIITWLPTPCSPLNVTTQLALLRLDGLSVPVGSGNAQPPFVRTGVALPSFAAAATMACNQLAESVVMS